MSTSQGATSPGENYSLVHFTKLAPAVLLVLLHSLWPTVKANMGFVHKRKVVPFLGSLGHSVRIVHQPAQRTHKHKVSSLQERAILTQAIYTSVDHDMNGMCCASVTTSQVPLVCGALPQVHLCLLMYTSWNSPLIVFPLPCSYHCWRIHSTCRTRPVAHALVYTAQHNTHIESQLHRSHNTCSHTHHLARSPQGCAWALSSVATSSSPVP